MSSGEPEAGGGTAAGGRSAEAERRRSAAGGRSAEAERRRSAAGGRSPERGRDRAFARLFRRCAASPAYRSFCRRVYGVDLCQTNVVDRPQLNHLAAALDLAPGERALDLGCGLGTLTEHLSDATGARLLGLDRCAWAVRAARRRTAAKRERLAFRRADLRELPELFPEAGGSDALIAVDSLYFLDDLDRPVSAFRRLLAPGGRGVALASELLPEGGARPPEAEIPSHTRLGKALARHGFEYETTDFSENEVAIWRRHREAARELREEFAAEGALDLLEDRLDEADRALGWAEAGRIRRYAYRFEA